jgi:hypothetical protein
MTHSELMLQATTSQAVDIPCCQGRVEAKAKKLLCLVDAKVSDAFSEMNYKIILLAIKGVQNSSINKKSLHEGISCSQHLLTASLAA